VIVNFSHAISLNIDVSELILSFLVCNVLGAFDGSKDLSNFGPQAFGY
jgi:hypothetical protein